MSFRAVLFDWDGTLADTAEASFRCYVRMFADLGIPFDRDAYARTYSPNWHFTYRALAVPEERWSYADERWLHHFACETVDLIHGAREILEALSPRFATGIVTSGGRARITRELEQHGLAAHVHDYVCGDEVKEKKPHPEGLLLCMDRLRVRASESVYVGDSPEDIAMARAAGVPSIAVPGNYPNRDALLAAKPDVFVESLRDALRVVLEE